jgi:protease IV
MKTRKNRWVTAAFIILALTVFSFIIASIISLFIGNGIENLDGNVAIISISGPIVAQNGNNFLFDDVVSSDDIRRLIRRADRNEKVKAIIFEINSPGGSAVASDEIAREIKKINKTTVAWIREIGTSGAYWISSSTDHIIANSMSITGSIGVIASYLGFSGFLEDHNVTYERLVSGNLKDIGSPFKEMTVEERILFEKSLDAIHDNFVEEVAKNRNLKKRDVEKLATGLFYLGIEAKELGLVDELGSRDEVIDYVEKQVGEEVDLVRYKTQKGFFSSLRGVFSEQSYFVGKGIGSSLFAKAKSGDSVSIRT